MRKPKGKAPVQQSTANTKPADAAARSGAVSRPPGTEVGPQSPSQGPPAGLDQARHAAAQATAHQAEVLEKGIFPAFMASALNLDRHVGTTAYHTYLANIMRELGDPSDPIERMLISQLCLVHFRVAQLHSGAGTATGLEATKVLNSVAARMLGEMRRTALTLAAYRTSAVPKQQKKAQLKLLKAAQ
ncbi:MAG: hypothetical protein K8U57_00590 [Planctomycetes bacterium]|nr:hypothetical protein [Planctomycetota bacterium]